MRRHVMANAKIVKGCLFPKIGLAAHAVLRRCLLIVQGFDTLGAWQVSRKQLVCPIFDCKTALTAQEVRGSLAEKPELLVKFESFALQVLDVVCVV